MVQSEYRINSSPRIIEFNRNTDSRGNLNSLEFAEFGVSFCRVFTISFSGVGQNRGEHAHKKCVQFLFSEVDFRVLSSNLLGDEIFQISPGFGLLVPTYNWIQVSSKVTNCAVVVLASEAYDPDDYIKEPPR